MNELTVVDSNLAQEDRRVHSAEEIHSSRNFEEGSRIVGINVRKEVRSVRKYVRRHRHVVVETKWGKNSRGMWLKLNSSSFHNKNIVDNADETPGQPSIVTTMAQQQKEKFALITGCTPGGIGYVNLHFLGNLIDM